MSIRIKKGIGNGGNGGGGNSTGKTKIKDIEASASVTVALEKKYGAYRINTPTADFSLTIDASALNLASGELYDFVLIINMVDSSQAYEVTWDNKIEWGNTSPTMTAMVKYMFSFCTDDGGTTWVGNQMFSFLPKGE